MPNDIKFKLEICAIYSFLAFACGGLGYFAYKLGDFNIQMQETIKKNKELNKKRQEQYSVLYEKIFGSGGYGYADTNFDKEIDVYERANAYHKLGLKDFPKEGLSLEQLEKLVKIYEGEN
ncbi:hypothetical protein HZA97_08170 [Candidatus Woesearchaeota archaeon]|nr:hypothetical protein [Candidatus Woesearchaeota archaeon]